MPFEIAFLVKYWSFRAFKSISLVSRCRSAFLLENDGTYAFFKVRRPSTEVLNKGDTAVGATLIEYFGLLPCEHQNTHTKSYLDGTEP